jgi:virginiamycin B lyase
MYADKTARQTVPYRESNVKPNTVVAFYSQTKTFKTWPIPSGGVARNMVTTPGGNLYLACSGVNKVAIVEINR